LRLCVIVGVESQVDDDIDICICWIMDLLCWI